LRDVPPQQQRRWNGLVKSILDGDADMAISALQITPDRSDVIDFSIPYLETGISILVAVRDGVISPMAFLGTTAAPPFLMRSLNNLLSCEVSSAVKFRTSAVTGTVPRFPAGMGMEKFKKKYCGN